jgi:hypothetical protein
MTRTYNLYFSKNRRKLIKYVRRFFNNLHQSGQDNQKIEILKEIKKYENI